jgi:integrase
MARRSYQEGTVYPSLNGKLWKARYRVWEIGLEGYPKRVQKNVTLGPKRGPEQITKAQAKSRLAQLVRAINEGRDKPRKTMALDQFVNEYSAFDHVRESTLQAYRSEYQRHVFPYFGSVRLCDIEPAHVQAFLNEKAKTLSRKTLMELRNLLSGVLRQPYEWGWLERNPARLVHVPQGAPSRRRPPIALTLEQAHRLLVVLQEPYDIMLELVLMTGLTRSELLALKWGRIDLKQKLVVVEEAVVNGQFGNTKTKNRVRLVPLEEPSLSRLRGMSETRGKPAKTALVFANRNGDVYDPGRILKQVIRPACEKAKIPCVGWHDLRHTHGTLVAPLLPDYLVRKQLGHSGNGVTFKVYVHDDLDLRREAVRRLAALLFPNVPKSGHEEEQRERHTKEQYETRGVGRCSPAVN